MQFSQEPFPLDRSEWSIGHHGEDTPFRPWQAVRGYISDILSPHSDLVSYNTTVEKAEKIGNQWKVVLRQERPESDYWWAEWFDAVIVASGHYWVPYIPKIPGLEEFERSRPRSVIHSKHFRGRDDYAGKVSLLLIAAHLQRVVVVGASVSSADIAVDLVTTALTPVHAVTVGHTFNTYFGDDAFQHPHIRNHPSIAKVQDRTVHFIDGTAVSDVDHIIFGTGYSWTLPFLPQVPVRNNRVPDLYQHIVWRHDPTLLFVGAVGAGLTFKIFEWQAILVARLLAGRATLPPVEEQERWEAGRIDKLGDGPKFTVISPDFEGYFETVRRLAGDGDGRGRTLPPFDREWLTAFLGGHERRKRMWRRINETAGAGNVRDASL